MKKLDGKNKNLQTQMKILTNILEQSPKINIILNRMQELDLKNYYIVSGCVFQTVWNYILDLPSDYGIDDIDIIYYDDDISIEKENEISHKINNIFEDMDLKFGIINEARAHLWLKRRFNIEIKQYISLENAIDTFGTTVQTLGIRKENGNLKVYAPNGLNDVFCLTLNPNNYGIFNQDMYNKKVSKYLSKWPQLNVMPWNEE